MNKNSEKIHKLAMIANRISFLATTERPFYVKRAVARVAIKQIDELIRSSLRNENEKHTRDNSKTHLSSPKTAK